MGETVHDGVAIALARTIRRRLLAQLRAGPLYAGATLPDPSALATRLGVDNAMIQGAYQHLEREGWLEHWPEGDGYREADYSDWMMEADLRLAVEREEFSLVYQPIVALDSGRLVGAEALLRWHHPQCGLLGPNEFIALAEETGLVVPIGRWALREACRRAAGWQARRRVGPTLTIAVNIAAAHLAHETVLSDVIGAVAEFGLEPEQLLLELTERTFTLPRAAIAHRLQALRAQGIRVAIDDFGTGYASLAYLRTFVVDVLKIPKSFVDDLGSTDADVGSALASVIIELGRALGLETIAEGIETSQQLEALLTLRCGFGQGHHFATPLSGPDFDALLSGSHGPWPVSK